MCSPTKCRGQSLRAAHTAPAIEPPCCSDLGSDVRGGLGMGGAQHATNTAPMLGKGGVDEVKELGRCEGTRCLHTCLGQVMRSDDAHCKRRAQRYCHGWSENYQALPKRHSVGQPHHEPPPGYQSDAQSVEDQEM